jgi:hypothetical protein
VESGAKGGDETVDVRGDTKREKDRQ